MPAEKSNGGSRVRTGPMSYRWVKNALGQQIRVFRVFGDIGRDEGAERYDLHILRAGKIQHAAYQRRADALAVERLRHFGVHDGERLAVALVIREGNVAPGVEFETAQLRIVADGIWHGHFPCTIID